MRKGKSVCAAWLACIAMVGAARAAVVFNDNFENVTGGTAPHPQAAFDGDPVAQVGTWTVVEPTDVNVQVTTDFFPIGNNALAFYRNGTGFVDLRANFAASTGTAAQPVVIRYKFKDVQPDGAFSSTVDLFQMYGRNATDTAFDNRLFSFNIAKGFADANGVSVAFDPGGVADIEGRWDNTDPETVWQQVEITVDFDAHAYTFTLNGVSDPDATNVPFYDGGDATPNGIDAIQQIAFFHYYGSSTNIAFDDFEIEAVPEPASAAMLALGGSMMFLRRRRTR
jgi:hypothetical protein